MLIQNHYIFKKININQFRETTIFLSLSAMEFQRINCWLRLRNIVFICVSAVNKFPGEGGGGRGKRRRTTLFQGALTSNKNPGSRMVRDEKWKFEIVMKE